VPGELKVLTSRHLPGLRRLVDRDPVTHCFVSARLDDPMDAWALSGQIWGWFESETLKSALYTGANLIPIETNAVSRHAFADRARRQGRRCSSMAGRSVEILDLWRLLAPAWGPAREVRDTQHLMEIRSPAQVASHPGLRPLRGEEIDLLLPAAVSMFTEEVGVSPLANGGGAGYRARLVELIRSRRALAIVDEGRIVFKAEIGSATGQVCQVQGVWVEPSARGRGLGTSGMAALVGHAQAEVAPVVSLYVNDFNTTAVAAYRRVGFGAVGTFATVLF
jgi:uncharacterized protein